MIFLRRLAGQATIEAIGAVLIMMLLMVVGTLVILQAFGSLILTKWASKTSHCVAEKEDIPFCSDATKLSLTEFLGFKNVEVRVKKFRGIIHSEVEGHLFKNSLLGFKDKFDRVRGSYDLEPSEYKRVQ